MTDNIITRKAYAKINIGLDIVGKKENGYHLIKTIMQQVDLYDVITLERIETGIVFETDSQDVPIDETNLAYKAAKIMMDKFSIAGGVKIILDKRIPVAAGMAGGSTDGAAVLIGINDLYGLGLSEEQLCDIGVQLGADIPFCIKGGCALCEGIGEEMTTISHKAKMYALITKPNLNVSTKHVYQSLGLEVGPATGPEHPDVDKVIEAFNNSDTNMIAKTMGNYLEKVTANEYEIIGSLKNDILEAGALGSNMSGSGPTVFGLFDDFAKAKEAEKIVSEKYPDIFVGAVDIIR